MNEARLKKTSLYLPAATHREVKTEAVRLDFTLSELLLAAFLDWRSRGSPVLERPSGCRPSAEG